MSSSTSMSSNELTCLQEQLERCKADKDFVWSLWKQLQKDSPNITESISMIVTREKRKKEQEHQQLVTALSDKEQEIAHLQMEVESQIEKVTSLEDQIASSELKAVESQKAQSDELNKALEEIVRLQSKLTERERELAKHVRKIEELLEQSGCTKSEMKRLMESNEHLLSDRHEVSQQNKFMEAHVSQLRTKLKEFSDCTQDMKSCHEKELSSLRKKHEDELNLLQQEMNVISKEKCCYQREIDKLTQQLKQCQKELNETKRMLSLAESRLHGNESMSIGPDVSDQLKEYQTLLEKTEKELFEYKAELSSKNEELDCLREKHERRLNRMKLLREAHDLLLKQIKTYETNLTPAKPHPPSLNKKQSLRHENSDQVWNELAQYKSRCQQLERDKILVDEEMDSLSAQCSKYKSTIAELRSSLQQNHHTLQDKEMVLREMSRTVSVSSIEQERVKSERAKLREENRQLMNNNRSLTDECIKLKESIITLQETIHQLQNELLTKRPSPPPPLPPAMISRSTTTKRIVTRESGTQATIMMDVSTETTTEPFQTTCSSSSAHTLLEEPIRTCSHNSGTQTRSHNPETQTQSYRGVGHRRRHSDGELLASYCLISQALDQLSHSLHDPPDQSNQSDGKSNAVDLPYKECKRRRDRCGPAHHKCKWLIQFKSCQQRMQTLVQQVGVLTQAKVSAMKSLEQCRTEKLKLEGEMRPLQDKIASQRNVIQELKNDLKTLGTCHVELQGRCNGLKSIGLKALADQEKREELEDYIKHFKEEKRALSERCTALTEQVKTLQTELVLKEKDIESLQEKCNHMDRDLKHKRQYVTEQKKKMSTLETKATADDEKLTHLNDHVTALHDSLDQYKHRLSSVKTQCEYLTKEKEKLTALLTEAKEELKSSRLQLKTFQDEHRKKLSLVKQNGEERERALKCDFQHLLLTLERRTADAETSLTYYKEFITDLAQEVSSLQERHQSSEEQQVTERARQIAQSTFNLSENELDQLMNSREEHKSTLQRCVTQFIQQGGVGKSQRRLLTEFLINISALLSH